MLAPESNTFCTPSPVSSTRPSGPNGNLSGARSVWKINSSCAVGPLSVTARSTNPAGTDDCAGTIAKSCSVIANDVAAPAVAGVAAPATAPAPLVAGGAAGAAVVGAVAPTLAATCVWCSFLSLSLTALAANPTATSAATMASDAMSVATIATGSRPVVSGGRGA